MKHAEPELFSPTVQLLRHALSLDLSVTFAPDGSASVSKGIPPTIAMNDSRATAADWVVDETDEGCIFEHGLHLTEYWAKWSVADDYPSPGDQNWRNWAWEFLRRNEQYALLVAWMNGLPEDLQIEAFNTCHIGTISTGMLRADCVTLMYHLAVSPANKKALVRMNQGLVKSGGRQLESNQPESG